MSPLLTPPPLPPSILRVRYPDLLHQLDSIQWFGAVMEPTLLWEGSLSVATVGGEGSRCSTAAWRIPRDSNRPHVGAVMLAVCTLSSGPLLVDPSPSHAALWRMSYRLGHPLARSGDVEDFANADSFPEWGLDWLCWIDSPSLCCLSVVYSPSRTTRFSLFFRCSLS